MPAIIFGFLFYELFSAMGKNVGWNDDEIFFWGLVILFGSLFLCMFLLLIPVVMGL